MYRGRKAFQAWASRGLIKLNEACVEDQLLFEVRRVDCPVLLARVQDSRLIGGRDSPDPGSSSLSFRLCWIPGGLWRIGNPQGKLVIVRN